MISKEHAEVVSDQVMGSCIHRDEAKSVVPRVNSRLFIALLVPANFLISFSHWTEQPSVWLLALMGTFFLLVILLLVCQARTPLIKIEQGVLTLYGSMPWQKKSFLEDEITNITFKISQKFWTSACSLVIETANERCKLWIPSEQTFNKSNQTKKIRQLSTAYFKSKYVEVNL